MTEEKKRTPYPRFTAKQKDFIKGLISDFDGPTSTASLLVIIDEILHEAKPDWRLDASAFSPDLLADVEACMSALLYYEITREE